MRIPLHIIRSEVYNHFGVDKSTDAKQLRQYVTIRQIFVYIAREYGYSLTEIGMLIGKTHASVINNYKRACDYIKTDRQFREQLEEVSELVKSLPVIREVKIDQAKREIEKLQERIRELGGDV